MLVQTDGSYATSRCDRLAFSVGTRRVPNYGAIDIDDVVPMTAIGGRSKHVVSPIAESSMRSDDANKACELSFGHRGDSVEPQVIS
jgi:hypothetical protein